MKIYDIVAEEKDLSEAPAGMLKQVGRKLGAKAAGAVGMKGTAAGLSGAAKSGDEANQLKVALKGYAGETGKNVKQMDAQDLAAFLQSKGYPTDAMKGATGTLTPKQLDDILLKSVQAKKVAKGGTAPTAATGAAPASGAPASSGGSNTPSFIDKMQDKVGAKKVGSTAPANDANGDGKDDTTGKVIPMPKKGAAKGGIPADIQKQLDSLTPKEKQALAGALK